MPLICGCKLSILLIFKWRWATCIQTPSQIDTKYFLLICVVQPMILPIVMYFIQYKHIISALYLFRTFWSMRWPAPLVQCCFTTWILTLGWSHSSSRSQTVHILLTRFVLTAYSLKKLKIQWTVLCIICTLISESKFFYCQILHV